MSLSAEEMVSPAMACLRVSILGMPPGQTAHELQALVAKLINAFLETRWLLPRRFEQMTPYAFVLSDISAEKMDKRELKTLAAELQVKLFGAEGDGEVSLLVFEGAELEVHRFAHLPVKDVERFLGGEPLEPPLQGALDRITADRRKGGGLAKGEVVVRRRASDKVAALIKAARPDLDSDLDFSSEPPPPAAPASAYSPLFTGLYLTLSQSFVGNVVMCRRGASKRVPSLLDPNPIPGVTVEAFDEGCAEAAVQALAQGATGLLYMPMSFSSLVRPAGRRAYTRFLCHLPPAHRARLGAALYDTPRDPSFYALSTIRRFLEPFVGEINLHVSDPDFEIDKLPAGAVNGVTLSLPSGEFNGRMAAVKRFLAVRDHYKRKRVWAGVGPLVNPAELNLCLALHVPVISGPAVSTPGGKPVAVRSVDSRTLPLA